MVVIYLTLGLLLTGMTLYLPHHLMQMQSRAAYYLFGRDGASAVVRVRDTGVGIPPEVLPHVFELFTQVDRTLNRAQGGLGIGLALVQQIVRLHGGSVAVTSDGVGKGTEFVVRLPTVS